MRAFVVAAIAVTALCCVHADVTTIWPYPSSLQTGTQTVPVAASGVTFMMASSCQGPSSAAAKFLAPSFARYQSYIEWYGKAAPDYAVSAVANISTIIVCVTGTDLDLSLDTDESYRLTVEPHGEFSITAATVFGALKALETSSQLIDYDEVAQGYSVTSVPITISDEPRFAWRGFMIDTARHYLPMSVILRTLDAMSFNKFNVLHWHLVDAQSFPYVSMSVPELSEYGAWHPSAVYSAQDIETVVQYAYARGIRVVPELDGPGHAAAWGFAPSLKSIVANCPKLAHNINNLALSPAAPNNLTFTTLQSVYNEIGALFPDQFFHLGGDEVVQDCWNEDPNVVAWMNANNMNSLGLYQYFINQLTSMAQVTGQNGQPKRILNWEDPFDDGVTVPMNSVIEVWMDTATLRKVVSAGYTAILAAGYYLDQQIPDASQTWYEWQDTWKNFYANDPSAGMTDEELSAPGAGTILGGEACMWAEQVNEMNYDQRVWPRACASAERFWSPQAVNDVDSALPRINEHSCRMSHRGIGSGPLMPGFCLQAPSARQ